MEEKHLSRGVASLIVFVITWQLGLASVFSIDVFGKIDAFSSNFLLTLGALLVVLFVGWKMDKEEVREELTNGGKNNTALFGFFYFLIKFIAPVVVMIIFVTNFIL